MKAREVSVGLQDVGGEQIIVVRLKLNGAPLERESIPYGSRVKENARRRREKEIQRVLESVEF